jgi:glycosyltransferase involved in cell wall biosynthesis
MNEVAREPGAPPDLVLITWNRRAYLEKTLANLLADPADFRLYCWDNGSRDGVAELIRDLDDPRVADRHLNPENVGQREPFAWFLARARGDVCGKIDDDILLPHGWTDRIAPLVRRSPRLGMLGCWIFMPEDWVPELARHNVREIDGVTLFVATELAGHSFLARRELLNEYWSVERPGIPVDRIRMTLDGYVSGNPVPLLFAHNMDDPRSEHCQMGQPGHPSEAYALTFRRLGCETLEEYAEWIASDARERQAIPYERQVRGLRAHQAREPLRRLLRRLRGLLGRAS